MDLFLITDYGHSRMTVRDKRVKGLNVNARIKMTETSIKFPHKIIFLLCNTSVEKGSAK